MRLGCNEKGSVDGERAVEYLKTCVMVNWTARGEWPSAGKPGVLVCDGVGTHLSSAFLEYLITNHIRLVLRTPHCSSKQQPEDLYTFHQLKNAREPYGLYKALQKAAFNRLAKESRSDLDHATLIETLKVPWALSVASNRKAWQIGGLCENGGITARPYYLLRRAQEA